MNRRLLLAIPIVLAACSENPVAPDSQTLAPNDQAPGASSAVPPNYFPLVPGATWTLKNYEHSTVDGPGTFVGTARFTVMDVETAGEEATASLRITYFNGDGQEQQVFKKQYQKKQDGIYLAEQDGRFPERFLPWPLSDRNEQWVLPSPDGHPQVAITGKQTWRSEWQRYPDSKRVSISNYRETDKRLHEQELYLAPNIGIVFWSNAFTFYDDSNQPFDYQRNDLELATYSIPVTP